MPIVPEPSASRTENRRLTLSLIWPCMLRASPIENSVASMSPLPSASNASNSASIMLVSFFSTGYSVTMSSRNSTRESTLSSPASFLNLYWTVLSQAWRRFGERHGEGASTAARQRHWQSCTPPSPVTGAHDTSAHATQGSTQCNSHGTPGGTHETRRFST